MAETATMDTRGIRSISLLNWALWAVQLYVAFSFLMAGWAKLSGVPMMVGLFQAIGIGQWFRYVTGSLEIAGAVLVLIPALCGIGGLVLTGVMLGAVATHLFVIGGSPAAAATLLILAILITAGRWERTKRLWRKA